ncbi:diacylglycerol kinase [Roseomonas sp. OT10]|uniref:diacylglycerol/lipid kinase family protein n=1 Tax=Roseomonas cutis TaxID=2897332 RepID=UPI001E29506D|nr:diacylglycerol kinase family protein [Roseomonas sp. OT10]UFN50398.1 diacylglycerol kinase [Roseomonas sp. OT10]
MTRAVLVLNTRAGTLTGRPELPERIEAILRDSGLDLRVIGEDAAPDMEGRLDLAAADPAELVIVGGGDGTLRGAAQRLAGTGRLLGILPLGTLNLLAKDLGLPLDPEEATQVAAHGITREIDVGEVNGEVFTCQSVLGLPNHIGRHRQLHRRERTIFSRLRLWIALIRAMGHPPLRLALTRPGDPRRRRIWALALSVVNNPYEESLGRLFHRPRLSGGVLAVYRPRRFGLLWAIRMLLAMALGAWRNPAELEILHTPALTLRSRRSHLRVMNDGEMLVLATPLEYRSRPGALRVRVPPPPVDAAAEGPAA